MSSTPPSETPASGPVQQRPKRRFRDSALLSGIIDETAITAAESTLTAAGSVAAADAVAWDKALAGVLIERGLLTRFQASQLLEGRSKLSLGQYRILDQIGQGGMGRVFKAQHGMMRRIVAVKVLTKDKATPASEKAFLREIERLGELDHENLLRALDAGHDGKVYYLVTEYIEGLDLRRQVQRYGPLDEVAAASVITQAARGLGYAHECGVTHRDVKPGNLLVTADGRVKVLDLGLAGSTFDTESIVAGRIIGTMDYMAPEQIRLPDDARAPADIYSLGCTLYFAVTGSVPFPDGTREEKASRQLSEEPVPVRSRAPKISAAFAAVIEAMMRKDPEDRPASAEEVIQRLKKWTPPAPVPMPRKPLAMQGSSGSGQPSSSRDSLRGGLSVADEVAAVPGIALEGTADAFDWPGAPAVERGPLAAIEDALQAPGRFVRDLFQNVSLRDIGLALGRSAAVALAFGLLFAAVAAALQQPAGWSNRQFFWGSPALIGCGSFGILLVVQALSLLSAGRGRAGSMPHPSATGER
jgi:serine/threonine protein kinase